MNRTLALSVALLLTIGVGARAALPVLLVYGFQPVLGFQPLRIWETFIATLSGRSIRDATWFDLGGHGVYVVPALTDEHRDVLVAHYASPYEPTVRSVRTYAVRLAAAMAWAAARWDTETDVVAHSMGGLIARSALASGLEGDLAVRTLITLATPHYGTELAASPLWPGPLRDELAPGSSFLAALNSEARSGDVRVVAMAGQTCVGCALRVDREACLSECAAAGLAGKGSDLVVTMESAWLAGAECVVCLGMNHSEMHTSPALATAIVRILDGEPAPDIVYATPALAP